MSRPVRLAINGYGRIGRCVLRALRESPLKEALEVVAINEPADLASMAYLSQFDSTHGLFPGKVEQDGDNLTVDGQVVRVTHERAPEAVDWAGMDLDIVLECSGLYSSREEISRFIRAGAPRVLVSHPAQSAQAVDFTVVYGINQNELSGSEHIVSNASCTTNAIIPVLDVLNNAFGLRRAFLTTLHSVMNDQPLIDGYHHADLRRTRSAMQSIVPVSTGLAQGVERFLPYLQGRVQAKAIRVPTLNVSAIDLIATLERDAHVDDVNEALQAAAQRFPGLIAYTHAPHASIDFNHNPHSVIIDGSQTRTNGDGFANVFVWFDNEWGFANRMLDTAAAWAARFTGQACSR